MLQTPSGRPASISSSPSSTVEAEVSSLGLTTAVQPAASAKGSFCATIRNGKFHGVMIETTPIGSRSTTPSMAIRRDWHSSRHAACGQARRHSARYRPRPAISPRAWRIGLPALDRVETGDLLASARRSGRRSSSSTAARSLAFIFGQGPRSKARRAAVTAGFDIGLRAESIPADEHAVARRDALAFEADRTVGPLGPSISICQRFGPPLASASELSFGIDAMQRHAHPHLSSKRGVRFSRKLAAPSFRSSE